MPASEVVLNAVFYVLAAAAAGGAFLVATSRNIVRSAFALLVVLFSVAGLYAVMKADFIAAAQVLIYVGGILVLIIFAVMLTHKITDVKISNDATPGPAALCAVLCLLFSLGVVILKAGKWPTAAEERLVRAGEVELRTAQFQKDARTPMAPGGPTFEAAAFLRARIPKAPSGARLVEFRVLGEDRKLLVTRSAALGESGEASALIEGLPPGKATWEVRLPSESGAATDAVRAGDFVVHAGLTEPVALALSGRYLFAFEAVSVLLLAALVGAAYLARKEVRG
jgi:NADH:ubiquinone oxidoreductase subunit 6 (subunit J)